MTRSTRRGLVAAILLPVVLAVLSVSALVVASAKTADAAPMPARAGHQQYQCNSGASDEALVVQVPGQTKVLYPGQCTGIVFTDVYRSVVVIGQSFRVRYDKTSGAYQKCQDLPNNGSGKRFTPASYPYKIDYLMYDRANCKHSDSNRTAPAVFKTSGSPSDFAVQVRATETVRFKASPYGKALYYDTNYRNGLQWKRFKPNTSRNFDSNDALKTSGRSVAIVRGLYRFECIDVKPNTAFRLRIDQDNGNLQAYRKSGCKN